MTQPSFKLNQISAGYALAAANAQKRESLLNYRNIKEPKAPKIKEPKAPKIKVSKAKK